jgi:lipopolysaccharide transport system permease protein
MLAKTITTLIQPFSSPIRHAALIMQLVRREVAGRYKGSVAGLAWSFFNPILMLLVYTLVFSGIFKARWGVTENESSGDFALILFAGLIVHGLIAECISRAPTLILGNINLVKKVIFPLEILPWVTVLSALFHSLISLGVLIVANVLLNQSFPLTTLAFPLVMIPLMLMSLGCTWFLSAIGVYIRDIAQVTSMLVTVLMFLSPVFYPLTAVPPAFQGLLELNPLTGLIDSMRMLLIFGHWPSLHSMVLQFVGSLLFAWAGYWWFQKARKGFADVL